MEDTKKGVNYRYLEDCLDQLRSFICERYREIYNYSPIGDPVVYETFKSDADEYACLMQMLSACYEEDLCD